MSSEHDKLCSELEIELELAKSVITASYDAAFGDGSNTRADAHDELLREAARHALLKVEWDTA